jgi:two-component system, NtrC family, sensor kinase
MTLEASKRIALEDRVQFLERKLAAKERTIDALMRRVEDRLAERSSSFLMLEQSLALEQVVTNKTADLMGQKARLANALEELRRTQAKLLQAQKLEAIGQLAAGIAHEVNTPAQYVTDNLTFTGALE